MMRRTRCCPRPKASTRTEARYLDKPVFTFLLYTCTLNNRFCLQDGLMEAANIPLQSKEEDQMWKILKTDERYNLLKVLMMCTVSWDLFLFSSIPFMCNWIYKNNSRHKYRKWKMEFSSSLSRWISNKMKT